MRQAARSWNSRSMVGIMMVLLAVGVSIWPSVASASEVGTQAPGQKWLYPGGADWSEYGTTISIGGSGLAETGGTFEVYGELRNVSAQVRRLHGNETSAARVRPKVTIGGTAVSVSVPAGVSFSVDDTTCDGGWWDNNPSDPWIAEVSFGSQTVCEGTSLVYISGVTYSITGGMLIGTSWSTRTRSDAF